MLPTLSHGNWLLIDTLQMRWRKPQSGDIVLIQTASNTLIVKRILLTPATPYTWQDNTLYLPQSNQTFMLDRAQLEEFLAKNALLEDHIFILGDNLSISYDSRAYGAVATHQIIGRVIRKSYH